MTEKPLDFSKHGKYDEYVLVEMPILGMKEVVRKKDGKHYKVLVCQGEQGQEISLFDWSLCERNGSPWVLKRALKTALDTAK